MEPLPVERAFVYSPLFGDVKKDRRLIV